MMTGVWCYVNRGEWTQGVLNRGILFSCVSVNYNWNPIHIALIHLKNICAPNENVELTLIGAFAVIFYCKYDLSCSENTCHYNHILFFFFFFKLKTLNIIFFVSRTALLHRSSEFSSRFAYLLFE